MRSDISLKQIAAASGLSVSTVSRVLREQPGTSAAARRAVAVALGTLGVRHGDEAARSGTVIAVVHAAPLAGDVDPFESLYLEIVERIFTLGWVAVRIQTGPDLASAAEVLESFGVAGAVVLGGGSAGPEAQQLAAHGVPVIRVSNARHAGFAQLVLDSGEGIRTAVRHLIHLGHRRIGLVVPEDSAASTRVSAFRRAMADVLHIPATRDQAPVVVAGPGILAGSQAADELLEAQCSAAISCAPAITFGFLESTRRLRLAVPQDFSLLTVGDMPDAEVIHPPMSQVTFDWAALAEAALRELERLMRAGGAGAAGPGGGAARGGGSGAGGGRTPQLPDYRVSPELVLRASERAIGRR